MDKTEVRKKVRGQEKNKHDRRQESKNLKKKKKSVNLHFVQESDFQKGREN